MLVLVQYICHGLMAVVMLVLVQYICHGLMAVVMYHHVMVLVRVQYICHGLMAVVMYHHVSTCTVYLSWFDGCSYISPCWYVHSIFVMV